jgi:hypothetical protein
LKSSETWESCLRFRRASLDVPLHQAIQSLGMRPALQILAHELCTMPSGDKTFIALYCGLAEEPCAFEAARQQLRSSFTNGGESTLHAFWLRVCQLLVKFAVSPGRMSAQSMTETDRVTQGFLFAKDQGAQALKTANHRGLRTVKAS